MEEENQLHKVVLSPPPTCPTTHIHMYMGIHITTTATIINVYMCVVCVTKITSDESERSRGELGGIRVGKEAVGVI